MGYMIDSAIAGVGIWIVSLVFKVAAFTFKIFMILAQSDILEEIEYGSLIENFYVLLGIIMLFVMAFSLLRGMVNPDDQKQGTSVVKKMIINFVVSCLILGFLPTIFQFGYDIQNSIIRWNVIGGFFGIGNVGNKLEDNDNIRDIETSAYTLVNGVYTAFFNVSNKQCATALADNPQPNHAAELQYCQEQLPGPDDEGDTFNVSINGVNTALANNFAQYIAYVDNSADFGIYGAFRWAVANDDIEFNFILLLIAGIALIYIGVSYCFDMALRLIKLIFYQLIAPIPIFLRVIPDSKFSGTFNKWIKVTLTCWMEVFVRIFIFYFCVFLCYSLSRSTFLTDTIFEFGWWTALFTKAFLLMGIVMFMKRSPKLLSEITGIDSGNMKLGIREKLAEGGGFVAGAAVGGLATAGIRNAVAAGSELKNKFRKDENGNIKLKEGVKKRDVVKEAIGGLGSIVAGGASGFFRSGRAGMSAKNAKDMASAAGKGAAEAVKAREDRDKYVAKHGGFAGAMVGHAQDALHNIGRWAGVNNITSLLEQNKLMEQIKSENKAIDAASRDTILSDMQKNKSESYGLKGWYDVRGLGLTDKDGNEITTIDFNTHHLRDLSQKLEAAKNSGDDKLFQRLQDAYDGYLTEFADKVSEQALKGDKAWGDLDRGIQADLSKVKQAADKYKSTIRNNFSEPFISSLQDAADILDVNKDITVEHSTMKAIKKEIDITMTENMKQINEIRQREADSKKGSGN